MIFTKSYKLQLLVGLGVGTWLVLFLVFIAPFDVADLSFLIRIRITIFYGLIFFICYPIAIVFQNFLYKRYAEWSLKLEILLYFFLFALVLPPTIIYYYSDIVNGDYPIDRFILEQYIPILIVITPVMFLLRRVVSKNEQLRQLTKMNDGIITFSGENRKDVLKVEASAIVLVQSSDNYVEVNYLENAILRKKLLRTTLKRVENQFDFLVRVHRSCLVNAIHFVEWADKDTAVFNEIRVPISKQYKKKVDEIIRP